MGAPAQEGGEKGCKVGEAEKAGKEGEAGLCVAVTLTTANTTINAQR